MRLCVRRARPSAHFGLGFALEKQELYDKAGRKYEEDLRLKLEYQQALLALLTRKVEKGFLSGGTFPEEGDGGMATGAAL